MKIRDSQGFSRSFKTSTNPVDRISTFDPVIKSSHCFSAMILTIFHQSRDKVKGESSTKLQPVAKMLRHFVPKKALLTSIVRKLQICHRRTFSPPFPVSMLFT